MATAFSATVKATQAKPWILTHKISGERYAYSNGHLASTVRMYAERGRDLGSLYTIVNEYERDQNAPARPTLPPEDVALVSFEDSAAAADITSAE